jgi:CspA family cold shock protein
MDGAIKKIVGEKGFGFIKADDGKDFFFHKSGLAEGVQFDKLLEGDRVTFEVTSSPKGPRAENVVRV